VASAKTKANMSSTQIFLDAESCGMVFGIFFGTAIVWALAYGIAFGFASALIKLFFDYKKYKIAMEK